MSKTQKSATETWAEINSKIINTVMDSRNSAIGGVLFLLFLTSFMAPFLILATAFIIAITIRNGRKEGFLVATLPTIILASIYFIMGEGTHILHLGFWLLLPAWVIGANILKHKNLNKMVANLGWFAIGLVAAQYLFIPNIENFWSQMIQQYIHTYWNMKSVTPDALEHLSLTISTWMPGGIAASWVFLNTLGIFVGLWIIAKINKSEEFKEAFYNFKMPKIWALIFILGFLPSILGEDFNFFGQLYFIAAGILLLQGISIFHNWVAVQNGNQGWIAGLYIILFASAPYAATAIAAVGLADSLTNYRKYLK